MPSNRFMRNALRAGILALSLNVALPARRLFGTVSLSTGNLTFIRPVVVGTTADFSKTVTLSNTGNTALTITSIVSSGDFSNSGNTCTTSLAAGASCLIYNFFTPTAPGTRTGQLTITDSDPSSPQVVNLTGIGTAVKLSATSRTFTTQAVGTTSAPRTVTVTNAYNTTLSFISIATTGDFSESDNCVPLALNGSCSISVTFKPTATGTRTGQLTITDSDPSSPQVVNLKGIGTAVVLSARSLTFTTQAVGTTSAPQSVTVTNAYSATLSFISIATTGDFSESDNCVPLTLNGSCSISVTFKPTATGTRTGALTLTDSDPTSQQVVTLSGSGVVFTILPEVGSTAGGTSVTLAGSNFQAGATVTFGGIAATSVSVAPPFQIVAVTPPKATPGLFDVTVNNPDGTQATLSQGFDYEPAPSTVYVSADFEDGTLGGFGGEGNVTTLYAHSGTHSAERITGNGSELHYTYTNPTNPPLSEANGLYQRWYQLVLPSTITNSQSGQIKMLLDRGVSGGEGWLMNGIGEQLNSKPTGEYAMYQDSGVTYLPGTATHVVLQPYQWYEIETWFKRVNGIGYVKVWIDGQLKMDTSSSEMGSDVSTDTYEWRFGLVYWQDDTLPLTMYLDDAAAANGFIEPAP